MKNGSRAVLRLFSVIVLLLGPVLFLGFSPETIRPAVAASLEEKPEIFYPWPWLASVDWKTVYYTEGHSTGVLIAPNLVLTALHGLIENRPIDDGVTVTFGDCLDSFGKETIKVKRIIIYSLRWQDSDVAILELERDSIQPPISLVSPAEMPNFQERASPVWAIVWRNGKKEEFLRWMVTHETCSMQYGEDAFRPYLHLCVTGDNVQGDSGSPLVILGPSGWTLVGIVSYAGGSHIVYTNLVSQEWIYPHVSRQ